MPRARPKTEGRHLALTGATSDLGALLLDRLVKDDSIASITAFDLNAPPARKKVEHVRVDLTHHDAEARLTEALSAKKPDAVVHLAFLLGPHRNASYAHEVEVAGTLRLLGAIARAQVPRLIVASTTGLYGARPDHPALLPETAPLRGCPASRFITDKVEVEREIAEFRERNPTCRTLVLRFAPFVGPRVMNPVTRFLTRRLVPTLLGFDPVWQVVHEDDAVTALELALRADAQGPINVVGDGVLPLSHLIRIAGGFPVPLPGPVARVALEALNASGAWVVPAPLLDYLHYSWTADGALARTALGFTPKHNAREAVASLRR